MEILSIGEKIKRARIYKGLTLRDISSDKLSVSKMSCVENDKVEAEEWVLEYISKKLDLNLDFLRKGVKNQIEENIAILEKDNNIFDYEKEILYNLNFAESENFYNLSFKLIHLLVNHYIDKEEIDKIQSITSKFYEVCQKSNEEENYLIYYMDMARFLFGTKEYAESANYYNNIRKSAKDKPNILAKATFNEAACYIMLDNYERAYEIAIRLEELVDFLRTDLKKAEVYQMLAMLSLKRDKDKFEKYEEKSYKYYGYNYERKARAIYNYSVMMFDIKAEDRAFEYMKKALSLFPKDNEEKLVNFMLLCTDELVDNNILQFAQEVCDEALDHAISLDSVKFIERAYYLKSHILQKLENVISAEMYMNLSLDALMKFGNNMDIYRRYMEMGYMYYNLRQTTESIKYFNLAMAIEKRM